MIRKLLNTTAFRLSLIYASVFSLICAGAMVYVYHMAESQLQQQTDARLQLETDMLLSRYKNGAVEALEQTIRLRNGDGGTRFFFSALISRGELDLVPSLSNGEQINGNPPQIFATRPLGEIVSVAPSRQRKDPARMLLTILPGGYQLLVGTDLDEQHALLHRLLTTLLTASLIIFALAVLGGSLVGRHVLRRLTSISETARSIIHGNLHHRVAVTSRNDEFDRLSLVLNQMLERIEHLMLGMRNVTDNLAHDLRTPLNRIRNRLETSQLHKPETTDYPQVVQDTLQDIDELIKTFNALLSIAQMEAGVQRDRDDWTNVDLSNLVDDLGDLYSAVAEEKQQSFDFHTEPNLVTFGNRQLIAQALTNLLDNAMKYTPAGGQIALSASRQADKIQIMVSDSGPGIPADAYAQVFKRFTRLDNARSSPGNGLGLSLVKAILDLHETKIELSDNQPGLKITLLFPASSTN